MRAPATQWLVGRVGSVRAVTAMIVVGLAASAVRGVPVASVVTAATLCAALVMAVFLEPRMRAAGSWVLLVVALLCGLAFGTLRVHQLFGDEQTAWADRGCDLSVTVVGTVTHVGDELRAPVSVRWVSTEDARMLVGARLLLEVRRGAGSSGNGPDVRRGTGFALQQGMILRVRGRLRAPEPPGPGGFDQVTYLRTRGIALRLVADADDVDWQGRRGGARGLLDRLRLRSSAHLGEGLEAPWPSLMRGIVLGETQGIPEHMLTAFRRSGTSHILSVSGLHVASLAAAVFLVVGALPVGRIPRFFMAAITVSAFALLTGAGVAVTRAGVMLLLWMVGRELGRGRDGSQLLALAAVFVLARNPYAVKDPGAQLSFAAVAGLMCLGGPLQRGLSRVVPDPVASGVAVSLAATVATAPFALAHFDQVSVVGVVANLLVVPVVAPVMVLGLASIAAGFVAAPLSGALNGLAAAALGWIVSVSQVFAQAPVLRREHLGVAAAAVIGAGATVPSSLEVLGMRPSLARLGRAAALAGRPGLRLRALAVGPTVPGGRPPLPVRAARRRVVILVCLLSLAGVCGGVGVHLAAGRAAGRLHAAWGARDWPQSVEVRVLDVGEGGATLVRTPGGQAVLIDAGPRGSGLHAQLRGLGVRRLDLVVLSHPHADHVAGLEDIAGRVPVGALIDQVDDQWLARQAEQVAEAAAYARLLGGLERGGTRLGEAVTGRVLRLDGVELGLFAPRAPLTGAWDAERLNASSVVVTVRGPGLEVLLPADAEASALARYGLPPVDVLAVPHHGSRDAVSAGLLGTVRPRLAVVSVGRGNTFGHPAPETMDALREAGLPALRTDEVGWVALGGGDSDDGSFRVRVARPAPGGLVRSSVDAEVDGEG